MTGHAGLVANFGARSAISVPTMWSLGRGRDARTIAGDS